MPGILKLGFCCCKLKTPPPLLQAEDTTSSASPHRRRPQAPCKLKTPFHNTVTIAIWRRLYSYVLLFYYYFLFLYIHIFYTFFYTYCHPSSILLIREVDGQCSIDGGSGGRKWRWIWWRCRWRWRFQIYDGENSRFVMVAIPGLQRRFQTWYTSQVCILSLAILWFVHPSVERLKWMDLSNY